MDIYNYDGQTGEFLFKSSAQKNPLKQDTFLIPANATTVEPPTWDVNETVVFDDVIWTITPDHRNDINVYYLIVDGSVVEFELGDAPDGTMSTTFPAAVQAGSDERKRVIDIEAEGLNRMQAVIPSIGSVDQIEFYVEFWLSVDVTARNPTVKFQNVMDIFAVIKDAIIDGTLLNDVPWQ